MVMGPGSRPGRRRVCLPIEFSKASRIQTRLRDLAAPCARVLLVNVLPFEIRGRGRPSREGAGNAGRPLRPQPRVQNKKAHEQVTTVTPESPGIPRAMVLTVSFVLSPVIGLSCHRHRCDAKHHHLLDASVEASGPHDFAVRLRHHRHRHRQRPPHPVPRS
jgi:hypothetical protein